MKKSDVLTIADRDLLRSVLHDYEPVLAIIGGAMALGTLENWQIGDRRFTLISRAQKWALLSGLLAIELQRAGFFQTAIEGGKVATGVIQDLGTITSGLLTAGAG